MRINFFFLTLILVHNVSCVSSKRGPDATSPESAASKGDVIVFYPDGNDIVVRNCGWTPVPPRDLADCSAVVSANRVPQESFERALIRRFVVSPSDKLRPLEPQELETFHKNNPGESEPNRRQKKELSQKVSHIGDFLRRALASGGETQKLSVESDELLRKARHELLEYNAQGETISRLNAMIKKRIKGMSSSGFQSVSSLKELDGPLYELLSTFDSTRRECGTDAQIKTGNLEARKRDCLQVPRSQITSSTGVQWKLVSRQRDPESGRFMEVWMDMSSGLLWGDRLESMGIGVGKDKGGMKNIGDSVCKSKWGKAASTHITERDFVLPTNEEFRIAEKNGLREVVPNIKDERYFSSTRNPADPEIVYAFYGSTGTVAVGQCSRGRFSTYSVRCVGR